ncbi:ABC-2 type transport system permease protein [Candidatus Planktophila limnetica]|jgi:ABC-2 type transport system permease protein|uniref:Transport permease protein n=3 Tax=root TaxID=1 RepID=A0A249LDS8_9ACTN|nr:ABC transporter permease [Candidatus Planktophila limnetica]ASY27268.1 ABC-2 type transport system permease protein [Candidatus Planktophila limnetica]
MNAISDSIVITKRQLLQLARVPEVLIFSTIQPVMFVLLFRYVFGGSIETGQPGGYVQLLMPGIFVQTVAFTLAATASGLAEDMKKGLIDRFRSLPIARSALILGRTLGDSLLNIVVLAVMGIAGFVVGWRPTSGVFSIILAFLFLLFFGYALSWVGIYIGLSARDARVVQNVSFLVTFPLTFLSNAFAPTTGMPRPLQYVAEWNPVSTMVAACRQLFGLENEFGATAGSFPSENPLTMSLIYMAIIMIIFVPMSVKKYQNASN